MGVEFDRHLAVRIIIDGDPDFAERAGAQKPLGLVTRHVGGGTQTLEAQVSSAQLLVGRLLLRLVENHPVIDLCGPGARCGPRPRSLRYSMSNSVPAIRRQKVRLG